MVRRPFLYHLSTAVISVALTIFAIAWPSPAVDFVALVFLASLIVVAAAPIAPVRSFLRRIAARTRDPVPSTI